MRKNKPSISNDGLMSYLYLPSGQRFAYSGLVTDKNMEKCNNNRVIAKYNEILQKLTHDERMKFIEKEFERWETATPEDILIAKWLIEYYDAELVESSFNEMEYSGKNLEEEISRLKNTIAKTNQIIAEKDAIIKQKTKEHDEYVKNNGNDESEVSGKYRYILKKGDSIDLTPRERNIIEYVIHCVALKPKDGLSANIKRLIGKEKTVSGHYNDSKHNSSRPLSTEEKKNIKRVLEAENIDYKKWLKDHI